MTMTTETPDGMAAAELENAWSVIEEHLQLLKVDELGAVREQLLAAVAQVDAAFAERSGGEVMARFNFNKDKCPSEWAWSRASDAARALMPADSWWALQEAHTGVIHSAYLAGRELRPASAMIWKDSELWDLTLARDALAANRSAAEKLQTLVLGLEGDSELASEEHAVIELGRDEWDGQPDPFTTCMARLDELNGDASPVAPEVS